MKNIKMIALGAVGLFCVGLLIISTIGMMDPDTPQPILKIGDTLVSGNLAFTVNSIEPFEASRDPDPNMMFVKVHFNVENNGEEEERFGDTPGVIQVAGESEAYEYHHLSQISIPYEEHLAEDVEPGETVSGYVSYEIPDNAINDIEMIFKDKKSPERKFFLAESSKALVDGYAETAKLMTDLGKICQSLINDSASDKAPTGSLQVLRVDPSSDQKYAFMRPAIEGYAESPESFEVLGCYMVNEQLVETCEYKRVIGSSTTVKLRRVKIDKTILLVNPDAKKVLRKKDFAGGTPKTCPNSVETEHPVLPDEIGEVVSNKEIFEWVQENWTP